MLTSHVTQAMANKHNSNDLKIHNCVFIRGLEPQNNTLSTLEFGQEANGENFCNFGTVGCKKYLLPTAGEGGQILFASHCITMRAWCGHVILFVSRKKAEAVRQQSRTPRGFLLGVFIVSGGDLDYCYCHIERRRLAGLLLFSV